MFSSKILIVEDDLSQLLLLQKHWKKISIENSRYRRFRRKSTRNSSSITNGRYMSWWISILAGENWRELLLQKSLMKNIDIPVVYLSASSDAWNLKQSRRYQPKCLCESSIQISVNSTWWSYYWHPQTEKRKELQKLNNELEEKVKLSYSLSL